MTKMKMSTFSALRSLSKLWPMRMVLAENMERRTACTSRMLVVTPSRSDSVMPLNL